MKKVAIGILSFIVCFAILIGIERGIVCLIDGKIEKDIPLMTGYMTGDLDESDRARTMLRLMTFTNQGESYDVRLADGSWFIDENAVIVSLKSQDDDDSDESTCYMLHNDEMMADYRSYTSESKHSYMTKTQGNSEYNDSFLYYKLVIDEFYIDREELIPVKYTIYMLSENMDGNGEFEVSPVKSGELTLPGMDSEAEHFLIQDDPEYILSGDTAAITKYAYNEESMENEYSAIIMTFEERDYSIEERRSRMEEAFLEKRVKRDLIGFKQFYNITQPISNELFGEGAVAVVSRRNVLYESYGLTSGIVMIVMAVNTFISAMVALAVCLIGKRKNKN